MSTPMFRTGAEKNCPAFWWFYTHLGRGNFNGPILCLAAQFLMWGVLMIGREKNHMDIPKLYPSSSSKLSIFSSRCP